MFFALPFVFKKGLLCADMEASVSDLPSAGSPSSTVDGRPGSWLGVDLGQWLGDPSRGPENEKPIDRGQRRLSSCQSKRGGGGRPAGLFYHFKEEQI